MSAHAIPRQALAWHIAVLAKTGAGKSYAIRGDVVEPLLDACERVCVVDPTDAWHGLRSSATGKSAGYSVVIFGGEHGDLPLGAAHGEAIAEIVGTSSTPVIIVTKHLSIRDRTRFFTDFAEGLMRKNKGPLHLVIDEAHRFAPKGTKMSPQSGEMLAAANELVSAGRSAGLRVILITQRPAKLHNDSLTQVETLVAMRMIGPADRNAVLDWVKENASADLAKEILSSLASLKTGEGWVWSPQLGYLKRVRFQRIKTFDSGAAPETASDAKGKVLAPIDRDSIAERLKAIGADVVANDPVALRKQIVELRRQLQARAPDAQATPSREQLNAAESKGYDLGWRECAREARALQKTTEQNAVAAVRSAFMEIPEIGARSEIPPAPKVAPVSRARQIDGRAHTNGAAEALGKAERAFLIALAQRQGKATTRNQAAIFAGYSSKSRHVDNILGALRARAYVVGGGDDVRITAGGLAALGDYQELPTGQALRDYWLREAGGVAETAMLRVIFEAYPDPLTRDEVAERSNYSTTSRHVDNTLGRLRSLDLIQGPGSAIRASEDLFT